MTQKTYTMADVCEKAHELTETLCNHEGIAMDCDNENPCEDPAQDHEDEDNVHYSREAQEIFNSFYDEVENDFIERGYKKEE